MDDLHEGIGDNTRRGVIKAHKYPALNKREECLVNVCRKKNEKEIHGLKKKCHK